LKLPKISLPSKGKGGEENLDEFDKVSGDTGEGSETVVIDEGDAELSGEEKETGDGSEDKPDDEDSNDNDFNNDEEGGERGGRKALMFTISGAVVLVVGILAGGAYWWFGGKDIPSAADPIADKGAKVALSMPAVVSAPSPGDFGGGLNTPAAVQGSQEFSQQPLQNLALGSGSLNALASGGQNAEQGLMVPSVSSVAFRSVPDISEQVPLQVQVPNPGLYEKLEDGTGVLPQISSDGRQPWQVYARPFEATNSDPRVAVIVVGLGLSRASSMAAIKKLPPEVSFVFDPYAQKLEDWLLRSRLSGHEVFLGLPLQSDRFPFVDAGPYSLSVDATTEENMAQLTKLLSRFPGYVGVAALGDSRFTTMVDKIKPVLEVIKARGLMYVDSSLNNASVVPRIADEIGVPRAIGNLVIDAVPSRRAIDARLAKLERIARDQTMAIAIVRAYPATIERLNLWFDSLRAKRLVLAPVSALVEKPSPQ